MNKPVTEILCLKPAATDTVTFSFKTCEKYLIHTFN